MTPVTNGIYNAWDVTSSGGSIADGVYNSYGINPPGTDWDDIACYLGPDGNIFEDINFYIDSVKDSYGIW